MIRSIATGLLLIASWVVLGSAQQKSAPVDDAALRAPDARNQEWLS
ncbi:MAG: hypothetical protein ACKOEC_02455 [Acidimicrobiia bacterium]